MQNYFRQTVTVFFVALLCPLFAQKKGSTMTEVSGIVTDFQTREPLIGVTIYDVNNPTVGTVTDIDGRYSITLDTKKAVQLSFSYVGYDTETYLVTSVLTKLDVPLLPHNEKLDEVVVTAGRFEQRKTDVTVSMEVIKPEMLRSQAPTDLSATLQTLPGVEIIDKQPSIRGGGGWTYSVGSRCQVLMDEMTILNPKTGEINWNNVPLENVAQVEVIKGASSVLYGSSALNGVINVRTQRPGLKPETKVSGYVGIYDNYKNYKYTGARLPLYYGAEASHSRRIGNFDVSAAISGFKDEGYRKQSFNDRVRLGGNMTYHVPMPEGKYMTVGANMNYVANQYGDFFIWRSPKDPLHPSPLTNMGRKEHNFNIDPFLNYDDTDKGISHKLRTRFYVTSDNLTTPSERMSTEDLAKWAATSFDLGKIAGYAESAKGWMDKGYDITNALLLTFQDIAIPIMNDLQDENWVGLIQHGVGFVQNDLGYTGTIAELQDAAAYAMSLVADNNPTRPEMTYNGYVDYQFSKSWKSGVRLTTGINWSHITNTANITGTHQTDNLAAYLQYDHRIVNRLSLSAGVRFEYYRMDNDFKEANIKIGNWLCPVRPVVRAGLNWEIYKAGFLRASFGQGYRNPSITEKFARKDIGGVGVYPNHNIKPERGYNAELGYMQLYKFGPITGMLDIAGFYTEYRDMIEYQFGLFRNSDFTMINSINDVIDEGKQMIENIKQTKSLNNAGIGIGAQFVNVGHARIYGAEVSTNGKVDINKDMNLMYTIGYTFTEPEDLDNKQRIEEEKTYTDPLQMKNKSNDSKYLKYRNKHSFKATIDYNYKWLSLGVNMMYRSKMLAVDYLMVDEREKAEPDLMDYARKFIFGYEDGVSLHDYWMDHNKGTFTMDLRATVRFKEYAEVQFLVNNLLNTEYSFRPMALAAPRTFVCRLNLKF
ncbi:MAG: TonB-dependent receptor [Paludibacteraceae bacterium]|nr:TonB-dependent receptor [Paludibacteraceae bacterium]